MFVGHYSASFAAKALVKEAPLGLLFVAAQWVDILFFPFALSGVETLRLLPAQGGDSVVHFELPNMPYTHSLLAMLIWGVLLGGGAWLAYRRRSRTAVALGVAVGLTVVSHWALDWLVHMPDMTLWGNDSPHLGLGLWQHGLLTFALEALLLLGAGALYLRGTRPVVPAGRWSTPAFMAVMLVSDAINLFAPVDGLGLVPISISALVLYLGFAAVAGQIDRQREAIA